MGEVFYGMRRKGDLIKEAVSLWDLYGKNYRLFKKMIEGREEPGKRIERELKDDYPFIPFLEIETETDVLEYLGNLEESNIRLAIRAAKSLDANYAYRTLKARTIDIRYLDSRHPKCPFRKTRKKDNSNPTHVMSGMLRKRSSYVGD